MIAVLLEKIKLCVQETDSKLSNNIYIKISFHHFYCPTSKKTLKNKNSTFLQLEKCFRIT